MYVGIDLGGTKIEGIVLASRVPDSVAARVRIPTEAEGGYAHVLHRIGLLVGQLHRDAGYRPESIGIGTPGSIDGATGLLKNSNTQCLNDQPFAADLSRLLGIPVRIANDANCFALAEYHMGVVARDFPDCRVMFGVIMGTGVGGGIVVDGQILTGLHGIAGEWGHMTLDPDRDLCYCGRRGCVETVLSGPALERYYARHTGRRRPLPEIVADPADPGHAMLKTHHLQKLGQALGQVINLLDPGVIVLGGGVGQVAYLTEDLPDFIGPNMFNPVCRTPIVRPLLGDSAGVFGAALLAGG